MIQNSCAVGVNVFKYIYPDNLERGPGVTGKTHPPPLYILGCVISGHRKLISL